MESLRYGSTPNDAPASGVPAYDLIAMIAHDLRTPVTSIKGFSQLALRRSGPDQTVGQYLTTVVSEADRLATMVDDLVLVSSVEQGLVTPKTGRIALRSFLTAQAQIATTREFPVQVATLGEDLAAQGDAVLLGRAFANLVRLALKYCRSGDSVCLEARYVAHGPMISIATHSTHLKTDFDEADVSSETYQPRGLSIYIATLLIEAQRGSIHTEPVGFGIRYQIQLPAAK